MSIPTLDSFTRPQRRRIMDRERALYRFADGPDVAITPSGVRLGFSQGEWQRLSPEDRRLYIRGVVRTNARQLWPLTND